MTAPRQGSEWLLDEFVTRTPGVAHAVVVSADGLVLAASARLPADRADQLAAVVSGLVSLTCGAARCFEAGEVTQTVVEMDRGCLLVMSISDGSDFAVLGSPDSDLGLLGFEMARQVERFGRQLDSALRQPEPRGATG
ncbi:MAG: roadblock/LC7 domain-containing protein [Umezawaea sp.]